jgi:hypothetical protein
MFRPSPEPPASRPPREDERDYLKALHDTKPRRESPPAPPPSPPPASTGTAGPLAKPGEFTGLMSGLSHAGAEKPPSAPPPKPAPAPPPRAAPPPPAAAPSPGSFTQVISGRPAQSAPPPAPAAASAPAEAPAEPDEGENAEERDPRKMVLIVTLAALGLAAVLLVLFVALT